MAVSVHGNDAFPLRTVKFVVPSAPGSVPDSVARMLANKLNEVWGQPVIVENMSGAGLNIGAEYVARAAADGYTLMVSPPPPLTVNNLLYRNLPYRTDQFVPITMLVQVPNVFIVRKEFPAHDVTEFINYARTIPGRITFGSQSLGSTAYLTEQLFESLTGVRLTHVPYRGEVPILSDIVGGHLDVFFGTLSTALPLFQSGMLKFLAVASTQRSFLIPDVPTIAESGLSGFQSTAWFALVGPPAMPNDLTGKLNRDVRLVMGDPAFSSRLHDMLLDVIVGSPDEARSFIQRETKLWTEVMKKANVPAISAQ